MTYLGATVSGDPYRPSTHKALCDPVTYSPTVAKYQVSDWSNRMEFSRRLMGRRRRANWCQFYDNVSGKSVGPLMQIQGRRHAEL